MHIKALTGNVSGTLSAVFQDLSLDLDEVLGSAVGVVGAVLYR